MHRHQGPAKDITQVVSVEEHQRSITESSAKLQYLLSIRAEKSKKKNLAKVSALKLYLSLECETSHSTKIGSGSVALLL